MRTTLTLDKDVAAQIERLRKARDQGLKDIVNEALRRGLREMTEKPKRRTKFRTSTHHGGRLLIDVDNVAEALAIAEGEAFR
jgi:hypothetical protein